MVMDISNELGNYFVNFDYRRDRTNCTCHNICRCATVEDVTFDSISNYRLKNTLKHIIDEYSKIDAYCVERLVKFLLLENKHLFEANVVDGYYGEEIRGWDHDNLGELDNKAEEILNLNSDVLKVLKILDYEYGYFPDHILDSDSAHVEEFHLDEIKFHNFNGMVKSYQYETDIFSSLIPIGIVNPNLDLIDGNHRVMNCSSKVADFIVLA